MQSLSAPMSVLVAVSLFAMVVAPAAAGPMPLTLFSNAAERGAVCNDGTAAGYYLRRGLPGNTQWLIFFQGGFWCWDDITCEGRWKSSPGLMSSKPWPSSVNYGGILSQDLPLNPAFANATMVYVPYCSSDVFSGQAPKTASTKWAFQGHAILQALIQDLAPLGLSAASDVAIAGCSAGGQTVVVNLDYIAGLVGDVNAGAEVRGIMDAGWFLDRTPMVPWDTAPIVQFQDALALWNGQVDEGCRDATGDKAYLCYFSPTGTKYLDTPFFMHTEQYDAFQVPWDVGHQPPYNGSAATYVADMRQQFSTTLHQIPIPKNGVFSGACFHHCITMGPSYYTIQIQGKTMAEGLADWYLHGKETQLIDDCAGFNCSVGCPSGAF